MPSNFINRLSIARYSASKIRFLPVTRQLECNIPYNIYISIVSEIYGRGDYIGGGGGNDKTFVIVIVTVHTYSVIVVTTCLGS